MRQVSHAMQAAGRKTIPLPSLDVLDVGRHHRPHDRGGHTCAVDADTRRRSPYPRELAMSIRSVLRHSLLAIGLSAATCAHAQNAALKTAVWWNPQESGW